MNEYKLPVIGMSNKGGGGFGNISWELRLFSLFTYLKNFFCIQKCFLGLSFVHLLIQKRAQDLKLANYSVLTFLKADIPA